MSSCRRIGRRSSRLQPGPDWFRRCGGFFPAAQHRNRGRVRGESCLPVTAFWPILLVRMLAPRRRFTQPLPFTTAVMVAVLVALASTFADANVGGEFARSRSDARLADVRLAAGFVLTGRTIAAALSNVAEGLEDDWTRPIRRATGSYWITSGDSVSCVASSTMSVEVKSSVSARVHRVLDDERRACDQRTAIHRRLLNLPPPACA
mgnify:CR=1 FL=1